MPRLVPSLCILSLVHSFVYLETYLYSFCILFVEQVHTHDGVALNHV
jgi:hypothetical protein